MCVCRAPTKTDDTERGQSGNGPASLYTLDGPFEERLARLAGRHAVMETGGHVSANQAQPLGRVVVFEVALLLLLLLLLLLRRVLLVNKTQVAH